MNNKLLQIINTLLSDVKNTKKDFETFEDRYFNQVSKNQEK